MGATFTCEVCNYSRELAPEYGGTTIKCPQCAAVIEVAAFLPAEAVAPLPEGSRTCPFCAEPIKSEARKCRWCGEILDRELAIAKKRERVREVERRRELLLKEAPGAKGALVLGLVGLLIGPPTLYGGFGLGPIAIVMGIAALRAIRKEPRLEGRGRALAGIILGILTLLGTILMIVTGVTLYGSDEID